MGIELGEYSHRPNTPEKVCRQRFGDCKDKALLLTSLLRAQGIEADLAYVHSDFRDHITERLPAPDRFNHAIVKARFRNKDYWIDATVAYQRGRLANRYNPPFKKALVAREGVTGLSDIPLSSTGSIDVTENFDIPSIENVAANLTVVSVYTGLHADEMRSTLANSALSEIETSYTEFYGKKYGKVNMYDSLEISDNDTLNKITLKEFYTIEEPWTIDSAKNMTQSFATPGHVLTSKMLSIDKSRKNPLALEYPMNLQQQIVITFPQNWKLTAEASDLDRDAYRFTAKSSVYENKVQLRYSFTSKKDHIPVEAFQQYRLDFDQLSQSTNYSFSWTPGLRQVAGQQVNQQSANWLLILIALATGALFGLLCARYNKHSLPTSYPPRQPWDFGSWLVLIIIGVTFSPIRVMIALYRNDAFNLDIWKNIDVVYANNNPLLIKGFLVIEVVAHMFILALTIFNIILLYRKRDIFPHVFCFLLAFNVAWCITDFWLADILVNTNNFVENTGTLIQAIVYAGIWIPVMLRSQRVKETFVVPYEA
jgi:hypothetical protein